MEIFWFVIGAIFGAFSLIIGISCTKVSGTIDDSVQREEKKSYHDIER